MKKYGLNELRQMFLDFFESKGHLVKSSYSLVPHNDNSLLLINAGMAPLKPYFTGQEVPPRTRMATCQKCIRTGDIENIGKTARHGTFFEMLGNFSFGDYFKHEAIHWSWEFLTEVVGLEADRLYPSVYLEDDEAFDIWNKEMGIPKDRIFKFGKEDNFWEHGAGPCGPCSEIYYDRGEKYGCGKPDCTVGCECDRYIEIWNNVFTQFENDGKGNYTTLKQKNIDTGMGLERLATVVQDVDSIFDVDTIKALRDKVCEISGKEYKKEYKFNNQCIMEIMNGAKKDLPNATVVLVLGILSLIFCWCYGFFGLILGIIAVVLAGGQRKLYLQSPDEYTESSFKNVNAGRVCGIISICIAGVVVVVLLLVLMGIVAGIGIASFGL